MEALHQVASNKFLQIQLMTSDTELNNVNSFEHIGTSLYSYASYDMEISTRIS